jgi:hypothetical protein
MDNTTDGQLRLLEGTLDRFIGCNVSPDNLNIAAEATAGFDDPCRSRGAAPAAGEDDDGFCAAKGEVFGECASDSVESAGYQVGPVFADGGL